MEIHGFTQSIIFFYSITETVGKYSLNVCIVSSIQLWVIKLPPPPRWQNLITFEIRIILWINSTQGYGKLLNRICCAIENRIFRFEMKILKKRKKRERENDRVPLHSVTFLRYIIYTWESSQRYQRESLKKNSCSWSQHFIE